MDTPPNFQSSLTPSDHSVIQSDSDSPGWPNWLPGGRQIRPVLLATLLLGALILMGFGMARDYAWLKFDTEKYILEDRAIRILDWEHISSIFSTYYFINYNPLHRLSYAIDYAIWGFDPGGFRTTNLLLHWTAGVFVFLCFYELTRRLTPAWLASICFVIHPTRVESVVWLAQRKDVLSAAFGFATLWMYLRTWRPPVRSDGSETGLTQNQAGNKPSPDVLPLFNPWWYAGCLVMYLCALASKAQWVPLCGVVVVIDLYRRQKMTRQRLMGYLPLVFLSAVFAWYAIDSQLIVGKKGANDGFDLLDPLIQPVFGLGFYLWHTLWPVNLCPRYADFIPEHSLFTLVGAIAVVMGGISVRQSWSGRREIFFGVAWFVMFLAPILNFLPGNLLVADRYLYVSLLGLVFPLGTWLSRQKTPLVIGFVGCVLVIQLGLTRQYVPHWKDDLTLWSYIVSVSKENGFALTALAQAQIAHKNYPAARDSLNRALTYTPCFTPIYLTYVEYERELGGTDALQLMSPALSTCPGLAELKAASGLYWTHRQEYRKAEACYLDSLRFRSTIEVLKQLAEVYEKTNEPEKGIEVALRALQSYIFDEEVWLTLGKLLELQGNIPQAETAYLQCIQFDPSQTESRYRLARIAFQKGDVAGAERWLGELRRVLNGKQLSDSAFTLWANIYREKKQYFLAIACLLEAVQVKSTPENWLNLIHLQIEAGQDPQPAIKRAITLHPEIRAQIATDPKLQSVNSE